MQDKREWGWITHSAEENSIFERERVSIKAKAPFGFYFDMCCQRLTSRDEGGRVVDERYMAVALYPTPSSCVLVRMRWLAKKNYTLTALAAIAASSRPNRPMVFHRTPNLTTVNKTAMVENAAAKATTLLASDFAGATCRLCTQPRVNGGDMGMRSETARPSSTWI